MEKKYKTVKEGNMLRIIALKRLGEFDQVVKGDRGGLIEKEENLSQEGDCWVFEDAQVSGNAQVYEDAFILESACVSGNAKVYGNAWVTEKSSNFW